MSKETKPEVDVASSLELLDIRLGHIRSAEILPSAPKPAYKLSIDFGKFGERVSVGRFTSHSVDDLKGLPVLGVLNLGTREIGGVVSDTLILGVQVPKAESGEATPLTPLNASAKIGGKVF